jgi:DNA-binding beta-propeller fold protein YncE
VRKPALALAVIVLLAAGTAQAHTVLGMDVSDLKPSTDTPREDCPLMGQCGSIGFGPAGLAWDGTHLWIGGAFGNSNVYRYDVSTCTVAGSIPAPSAGWLDAITGLAWDGANLWCHPEETGLIYRLDPADGSVLDSFEAPSFGEADPNGGGLAWDGTHLWHVNSVSNILYKLDPTDCSILDSFSIPSGYSSGLASWDGKLVVANISTDQIHVIDPSDGSLLSSCGTPCGHPWGVAPTGAAFWLSGHSSNAIFLLDIFGTPVEDRSWGTIKAIYR